MKKQAEKAEEIEGEKKDIGADKIRELTNDLQRTRADF